MTKLSPKGITGVMMGTWFLATAFAEYAASLIAQLAGVKESGSLASGLPKPTDTVMVYGSVFGRICLRRLGSACS